MTFRERGIKAISFSAPDRAPIVYTCTGRALLRHGEKLLELTRRYPNDFYPSESIAIPRRDSECYRPDGSFYKETTDEWGCVWAHYQDAMMGEVKRGPLDDWSKLKAYRLPPPKLATEAARSEFRTLWQTTHKGYPVWGPGSNYFERMQYLRGVEDYYCDVAEDRPEIYELADRVLYEYILPSLDNLFRCGIQIDIVGFGDDWGSQTALLISPAAWRRIFKPRYRAMFEFCRRRGALVHMHSDGVTREIIPDLIEIGLNSFNPQLSCQDPRDVKRLAGQSLSILTDIDRQHLLPFGTPSEIAAYVRDLFEIFGSPRGGLVWNAEIGGEVPLANAEALLKAFHTYRTF
jgi:uroporphyrinogen decarboxylase